MRQQFAVFAIVALTVTAACTGEVSSDATELADVRDTRTTDTQRPTDASDISQADADTDISQADADADAKSDASSSDADAFSLKVDPDFDPAALEPEVRIWWERMRTSIRHEDRKPRESHFANDNLYHYARPVHTYLQSVLLSLRATGDPAFLDEATRVLDLMREQLRDEWYDTLDGTDGTSDGYLNWTYQGSGSDDPNHNGKDLHKSNEIRTHSIVFQVLAALEANRSAESPGGWDYGAEADFWRDYLFEHFVAKWEDRDADRGYDGALIHRPHTHTSISNIKLHYYLWQFGGDDSRLEYANRLAEIFEEQELDVVDSAYGDAYVWPRSFHSLIDRGDYLHPTTYARYVVADAAHFHLLQYRGWKDGSEMSKYARPLAAFVFDDPPHSFASSIGGDQDRGAYWYNDSFDRQSTGKFSTMPFTHILAWDDTGELEGRFLTHMEALDDLDDHPAAIPMGGFLFAAAWKAAQ